MNQLWASFDFKNLKEKENENCSRSNTFDDLNLIDAKNLL